MQIIIHRGINQIGGCITEISTATSRIFIDMGDNLPGNGKAMSEEEKAAFVGSLFQVTDKEVAVFYTHYHGDHVGLSQYVPEGIPQYIGKVAKQVMLVKAKVLKGNSDHINAYKTYDVAKSIKIGDIIVKPFLVSHSACDAYMFLVEADGKKILHSGDYRNHGYIGKGLKDFVSKYIGQVDYLITEGTMLSRTSEKVLTEGELRCQAHRLMKDNKYNFVICSSTDIDRLATFYNARPKGYLFVCDTYQAEVLNVFTRENGTRADLYKFTDIDAFPDNTLLGRMLAQGFCMLVRPNDKSKSRYKDFTEMAISSCNKNKQVFYSMWQGYIQPNTEHTNESYIQFLGNFDKTQIQMLHTSGHASPSCIKELIEMVNPREGIIGVHKEDGTSLTTLDLSDDMKRKIIPENKQTDCVAIR